MKLSGPFILMIFLLVLGGGIGVWWIMDDAFFTFTQDELRSAIVATAFAVFLAGSVVGLLRADDERTYHLSGILTAAAFAVGAITLIANTAYKAAAGQIADIGEALAWTVPASWTVPVVLAMLFFVAHAMDRYWGVDRKPIAGRSDSPVIDWLYNAAYGLDLLFAMLASAFGTYHVAHALTGSFWHSAIYVLNVELAILVFSKWNGSTNDRGVFWYTFGITLGVMAIAAAFQVVDAFTVMLGDTAGVGPNSTNPTVQLIAQNFVLLPPIITVAVLVALYVYNQRKPHSPLTHGVTSNRIDAKPEPRARNSVQAAHRSVPPPPPPVKVAETSSLLPTASSDNGRDPAGVRTQDESPSPK